MRGITRRFSRGVAIYVYWRTDMATTKFQVQLVLKMNEEWGGDGAELMRKMLTDEFMYPKFLFSSKLRFRLGYDPIGKFRAIDWDYGKIDMEAPEYTVSTQSMTYNFIMEADTYPRAIVDILQANGWTVTGRHRMDVSLGNGESVWESWDSKLEEAGRGAAWTSELEEIKTEAAKVDGEIRDCREILAIVSVSPPAAETEEEKTALMSQTVAEFTRGLTVLKKRKTKKNMALGRI